MPAFLKASVAYSPAGTLLGLPMAILSGTFVDETREASVRFPEDYSEPKLAAKDATIRVTVRGVKEKVLPPLDDDLAKQLSAGKQENVADYRAAVRADLEEASRRVERMKALDDQIREAQA